MCGIAGIYNLNKSQFDDRLLLKMRDRLSHRGPDANGIFVDDKVGLAHRRLSVIDLSSQADQPMKDSSGRYVIVYNGELYNYKDIADNLDLDLSSNSDTEIVLESYIKWGRQCLKRFNGMFAFAIYDRVDKKLTLCRDRVGIKPLYYFWNGESLVFASELKAFQSSEFNLEFEKDAIEAYLNLGYIPEPLSIYKNVYKLPAGATLEIVNQNINLRSYWSVEDQVSAQAFTDEKSAKSILHDLIKDSVRKRMISDVPLGTFLSGGIDSSLVTAIAQANSNESVKTFSIGIKESKHSEVKYAAQVAEHLKTDHHEFILDEVDAVSRVDWMLQQYDEPFGDSSAIPTELVSEKARKHVTVCLSGDGGDELFLGYGAYKWAQRLNNPLYLRSRKLLSYFMKKMNKRYKRASLLLDFKDGDFLPAHIFSQEQYLFSNSEIDKMISKRNYDLRFNPELRRELSKPEQQALFDLKYYLRDDLLVKVDRASMFNSLEVRVPLLDHRIVNVALNLPLSMKLSNGKSKIVLRSLLENYVPQHLFDRPKWGFGIPLERWMRTTLKSSIEKVLSKEIVESMGFVKWEYVSQILLRFDKGESFLFNRIWLLYTLHKWAIKHNSNARTFNNSNHNYESAKTQALPDM
ncbi:MAG: asparagine synthase (glutamine-hydrolyzing) [Chitinophagales bacterium]|nr:asparagine synthase (glutamine-hydrolyzing) [Chitinophagales bacterium]